MHNPAIQDQNPGLIAASSYGLSVEEYPLKIYPLRNIRFLLENSRCYINRQAG